VLLALPGFARRPAVLDDLLGASDREGSRWDVLGDRGAGSDISPLANREGGDEARVRADEGAIADLGLVLATTLWEIFIRACGVPEVTPGSMVTVVKPALVTGAFDGTKVVVFSSYRFGKMTT